jgi:hypothetical protein
MSYPELCRRSLACVVFLMLLSCLWVLDVSHGLLRHLIHDLILNKINKMVAYFFHLLLVHIVGFHRILYSCPINLSDGEHKEQLVQRLAQQQKQQLQQPRQPRAVDCFIINWCRLYCKPSTTCTPTSRLIINKHLHLRHHTSFVWLSSCIDIILGMDWLIKYDGVILCAKRAIRLT